MRGFWSKVLGVVVALAIALGAVMAGGEAVWAAHPSERGNDNSETTESTEQEGNTSAGDSECVETAIIGEGGQFCNDRDGGVKGVLMIVVNILTVGVGVLGVVGITVVGLQYLTAGGSEEKTRKAKRRLFEIVIGLVAYVMIYAILRWLLPGFGS